MSLLGVLSRLQNQTPDPFVAPIIDAQSVRVLSVQQNVPYWFTLQNPEPGWWRLVPTGQAQARLSARLAPPPILDYLAHLPRFLVIALFPAGESSWLCVPFNRADAAQRGWPEGSPRLLHLVRHRLQPLDVVVARSLAGTLLYDTVDERLGYSTRSHLLRESIARNDVEETNADLANACWIIQDRLREQRREQTQAATEARRGNLEAEIRHQLDFMGANLVGWQEGETITVTYEYNGMERTVEIGRDFRTVSAGICLDDTDRDHDLASVVNVLEEARRLHRFDLPREDWL